MFHDSAKAFALRREAGTQPELILFIQVKNFKIVLDGMKRIAFSLQLCMKPIEKYILVDCIANASQHSLEMRDEFLEAGKTRLYVTRSSREFRLNQMQSCLATYVFEVESVETEIVVASRRYYRCVSRIYPILFGQIPRGEGVCWDIPVSVSFLVSGDAILNLVF